MCENPKMSGQIKFRIHVIRVPKVSRFDIRISKNLEKKIFFFQFFLEVNEVYFQNIQKCYSVPGNFREF